MLVLTRKQGECIVIGRDIVVTIVECSARGVRLGITAPREVPIQRQELLEKISRIEGSNPADDGRAESPFFPECS